MQVQFRKTDWVKVLFGHFMTALALSGAGFIGYELELVIRDRRTGRVVGKCQDILAIIRGMVSPGKFAQFMGEFQAHQIELATSPQRTVMAAVHELVWMVQIARRAADMIGCDLVAIGYLDEDTDFGLQHVSTANPRYMQYAKSVDIEVVQAMMRVAGLQVVFGIGSLEQSLRVNNRQAAGFSETIGRYADPRRVASFQNHIFPNYYMPRVISSHEELVEIIREAGCLETPGQFYVGSRVHPRYPTQEGRGPDATDDVELIIEITRFHWEQSFPGIPVPMSEPVDMKRFLAA